MDNNNNNNIQNISVNEPSENFNSVGLDTNPIENKTKEPISLKAKSKHVVLFIVLSAVCGIFVGFVLGYFFKSYTYDIKTSSTTVESSEINEYTPGYRGGINGVKLTKSVNDVALETLMSIKTSFEQYNGQYPPTETEYMLKIAWKYGYNYSSGSNMQCPRDNGTFSYVATRDQKTGEYRSFDLYYCDETNLIHKTELDL